MDHDKNFFELILKLFAVGNLLHFFGAVWTGILFPIVSTEPLQVFSNFLFLSVIFMLDLIITSFFVYQLKYYIYQWRRIKLIFLIFIIISFLTRLLTAGIAGNYVLDESGVIVPILIGISSLLFGMIFFLIRKEKVVADQRNKVFSIAFLNFIPILNLFHIVKFFTPLLYEEFNLVFLIIIFGTGLIKVLTPLITAILIFIWSMNVREETINQTMEAWPSQV